MKILIENGHGIETSAPGIRLLYSHKARGNLHWYKLVFYVSYTDLYTVFEKSKLMLINLVLLNPLICNVLKQLFIILVNHQNSPILHEK